MECSLWRLLLVALFIPFLAGQVDAALPVYDCEDVDYLLEHVAEGAMDNRLLTLPWGEQPIPGPGRWHFGVTGAYNDIRAGLLKLHGPGFGIGAVYRLTPQWSIGGMGFRDQMRFASKSGNLTMVPLFANTFPVDLPAHADFSGGRGTFIHQGLGIYGAWQSAPADTAAGIIRVTGGLLYERVALDDFRIDFTLTDEADAGRSGVLDHSSHYNYVTPVVGISWSREYHNFRITPRLVAALPLPRRPWAGQLTVTGGGTSSGNTEQAGNGKHMGDVVAGLGLGVTYLPFGCTLEVGASLNQLLLEKHYHHGISRDILVCLTWEK